RMANLWNLFATTTVSRQGEFLQRDVFSLSAFGNQNAFTAKSVRGLCRWQAGTANGRLADITLYQCREGAGFGVLLACSPRQCGLTCQADQSTAYRAGTALFWRASVSRPRSGNSYRPR